jgi:hypothetical protein
MITVNLLSHDAVEVKTMIRVYHSDSPTDYPDYYTQASLDPFVVKAEPKWSGNIYIKDSNEALGDFTIFNSTNPS